MKPITMIRRDLKEIRYYYARKEMFDRMEAIVANDIVKKVKSYNLVISKAPVMLYDLYMSIYVFNNTQAAVADDWDVSFSYIRKLHEEMLGYIQMKLSEGEFM